MENKLISSIHNPIIKNILLLQKKKSARKAQKLFIVEGLRAVKEIPKNHPVKYYITTESFLNETSEIVSKDKWIIVTEEIYKAISETMTPQGIMAVVESRAQSMEELQINSKGFYLVLENIQDPGNLGTIIRTAHGLGVSHIILTKGCVDPYSPKAVRSTMGSIFHIEITIDADIDEGLRRLKDHGIYIYATALEEAKPIYEVCFQTGMALIIGNEGNGISDRVRELSDQKVMIPMPGGAESLNASVAASICIYEIMRQTQRAQ